MNALNYRSHGYRYLQSQPTKVRREPRLTFAELAGEFGVTARALQGLKRTQPGLVALPLLKGESLHNPKHLRYSPSAARAWWDALPAHIKGIQ